MNNTTENTEITTIQPQLTVREQLRMEQVKREADLVLQRCGFSEPLEVGRACKNSLLNRAREMIGEK